MNTIKLFFYTVLLTIGVAAQAETATMHVDGLVCAFCGSAIEKKLKTNTATADVFVSLEHKIVAVGFKNGQTLSDDQLRTQITDAGYQVKSIERSATSVEDIRRGLNARKKE